jgi:hypothetical protein
MRNPYVAFFGEDRQHGQCLKKVDVHGLGNKWLLVGCARPGHLYTEQSVTWGFYTYRNGR